MNVNIYKIYGISAGIISLLFGIALLFFAKLDAILADNESTAKDIRKQRMFIAILAICGGLTALSVVLFGWPPVRGYIIPPR